jgi:hypothetical protein
VEGGCELGIKEDKNGQTGTFREKNAKSPPRTGDKRGQKGTKGDFQKRYTMTDGDKRGCKKGTQKGQRMKEDKKKL